MNLDQYQHLVEYLETDELPPDLTKDEQRTILKRSRFFELRNKILYKKNRKDLDKPFRVIK